jgi:ribonucleoside-diphosphate reductase alpha chain
MEVFSRHIDSAMSKTINLPNDYSYDEFKNIYRLLYDTGAIKGGTTYRAGTMAHVLSSTENKAQNARANEIVTNNSPKRPKDVPCDIIRFQNQGEKWIGFMGILKGKPYEMFTGRLDAFNVPSYVENGVITKHKNGNGSRYDLVYTDRNGEKVVMEALNRSFEREFNNITKMLSAVLRHGMPLLYVYDLVKSLNLKFDNVEFGTWKACLG